MRADELRRLVHGAVEQHGYAYDEARIITQVLLYAELRGNSQGLIKLVSGGLPRRGVYQFDAAGELDESASEVFELLSVGPEFGMLSMHRAVRMAAKKCFANGIGVVATHDGSSSTGAIGFWARALAHRGLVAIVMSGSMPFVAPHGSRTRVFGTNPIAFACPTGEDVRKNDAARAWASLVGSDPDFAAFHVDLATSAIAYYDIVARAASGEPLPHGVALDAAGRDCVDAQECLDNGAVKTFGSHKGSALSLIVEILTGPLVRAGFGGEMPNNWGNLIIAIDPERLGPNTCEQFAADVSKLLDIVRTSKPAIDASAVHLPGTRGDTLLADALLRNGDVRLRDDVSEKLSSVARLSSVGSSPSLPVPASPVWPPRPNARNFGGFSVAKTVAWFGAFVAQEFVAREFVRAIGWFGDSKKFPPKKVDTFHNVLSSFLHAVLSSGVSALGLALYRKKLFADHSKSATRLSTESIHFSCGYMLFDLVSMAATGLLKGDSGMIVHHLATVGVSALTLHTGKYHGLALIMLVAEINSVFLHIRTMLKIGRVWKKPRARLVRRLVLALLAATFVVFRFVGQGGVFLECLRLRKTLPAAPFSIAAAGTIQLLNIKLARALLRAEAK